MENAGKAEQIITRAHQWNFEGDCTLLSWMQELSQNLEQRASTTKRAMEQLSVDVNRAAIALDNTANSLTALQYTQFVESRCHDDDETISAVTEVPVAAANANEHTKTPNETLKTFLRKNLEMLQKCHEKYAIQLDDSDEDEEVAANNCIYQAKNPYNERLLPHIYGSKLWKENWHVGLCDGTNEYSGDETSEAFSESSTSAEDNESYESNTANLSEWASSTSIGNNENKYPTNITVQNASIIQAPPCQPILPAAPYNAGSDTSSTTSRTTSSNKLRASHEHDLFSSLQDTPPTSNSSSASSRHPNSAAPAPPQSRNLAVPPLYDITPPPDDIFTDASNATLARTTDNSSATRTSANQIKRKPVNLFDDDDFNSFMTEIVEKAESKAALPIPATRTLPASTDAVPTAEQRKKVVELFDEKQNDFVAVAQTNKATQQIAATATQQPLELPKEATRKPVNLFDSTDNSPMDGPLFPQSKADAKEAAFDKPRVYSTRTKITAKSLFDDDDDDDFLNVFAAKKVSMPKPMGKTLLFDDADDDDGVEPNSVTAGVKENATNTVDLFADMPKVKTPDKQPVKTPVSVQKVDLFGDDFKASEESEIDKNSEEKVNLFADVSDENDSTNMQSSVAVSQNMHKPISINLFSDEFENVADEKVTDGISEEIGTKTKLVKTLNEDQTIKIKTNNFNEQIDVPADSANSQIPKKTKHTNLFNVNLFDDIDEEDDLFSNRPKTVPDKRKESTQEVGTLAPETPNKHAYFEGGIDAGDLFEQPTMQTASENPQILTTEATATTSAPNVVIDSSHSSLLFGQEISNSNKQLSTPSTELIANVSEEINIDDSQLKADVNTNLPSAVVIKTQAQVVAVDRANDTTTSAAAAITSPASTATTSTNTIENAMASSSAQTNVTDLVNESASIHTTSTSGPNASIDVSPIVTATQQPNDGAEDKATASTFSASSDTDKASAAAACVTKEASATALNYTGIFLDEPPDDDDFFQTLSNTPTLTSKFALDLEQDFYEPALPPPPSGSKEGHKLDADYSGLRLFSEVPPDDDGQVPDVNVAANATTNQSQRLHSVFYDDFNETMAAVQQINEQKISTRSLFDDEPPPDDDNSFDIVEKLGKIGEQKKSEKMVHLATEENLPNVKETVDKRPEKERLSAKRVAVPKLTTDEPDKAKERVTSDIEKSRNAVGIPKLQMPNIKINVQALLPGASGKPNFKKSRAESAAATAELDEATTGKGNTTAPAITTTEGATSNEKMLANVCKHRVRAPAKRRPSTRKGRQENYRNSLLAEQAALDAPEIAANPVQDNSVAISPKEQTTTTISDQKAEQPNAPNNSKSTENKENTVTNSMNGQSTADLEKASRPPIMPIHSNLLSDKVRNEDNGALFSQQRPERAINTAVVARVSPTQNIAIDIPKSVLPTGAPSTSAAANKLHSAAASALFGDSDGNDDDDLFEPVSAVRNNARADAKKTVAAGWTPAKAPAPAVMQKKAPLQSSFPHAQSDSEDDIFESSLANISKPEKKLERRVVNSNKKEVSLFGSDDDAEDNDADFLSNLKKPENRKMLAANTTTTATIKQSKSLTGSGSGGLFSDIESDEDDLFSGQKKAPKGKYNFNNQTDPLTMPPQPTAATPAVKSTKSKTVEDNPLADLLNS